MKKLIASLFIFGCCAVITNAQSTPIRIIVIGAHPDDPDSDASGTAALWVSLGHAVKFVSVTNGDAGHQSEGGGMLVMSAA